MVEPAGEERVIIRIHHQNFTRPELVFNEDARCLMLGERGKGWKAWLLRNFREGGWGLAADSRSGIDPFVEARPER